MHTRLKHGLMLQSLSSLALLTIIRNFLFQKPPAELVSAALFWGEFFRLNMVLIVVFMLCAAWVIAAVWSVVSFSAFKWTDKKKG